MSLPPFWSLVETHGGELLAHARRLAGDAHAEDVLQDALLRALRAYPNVHDPTHLRAWLYRVTTTTAVDHHRARRREILTDDPPATVAEPEYYDDAFDVLIGPLSGPDQAALRLRFVDDLEYEVIAGRLDISPEAARQRVSSALGALRQRIAA